LSVEKLTAEITSEQSTKASFKLSPCSENHLIKQAGSKKTLFWPTELIEPFLKSWFLDIPEPAFNEQLAIGLDGLNE
jgi:hypothetical protein